MRSKTTQAQIEAERAQDAAAAEAAGNASDPATLTDGTLMLAAMHRAATPERRTRLVQEVRRRLNKATK